MHLLNFQTTGKPCSIPLMSQGTYLISVNSRSISAREGTEASCQENQGRVVKLTPSHLDIVDVHGSNIAYALLICMFLFFSPNPSRIFACDLSMLSNTAELSIAPETALR